MNLDDWEALPKKERLDLIYGGSVTRTMSSSAPNYQSIPKSMLHPPKFALDMIDIELLNPLNHPTQYQRMVDRKVAIERYTYHASRGVQERLAGDEVHGLHHLKVAEQYCDKYQFTQEEINGSSA